MGEDKRLTSSELKGAEPASKPGPDTGPGDLSPSGAVEKTPKRMRRPLVGTRFRFGIQSKILVAMLLSSILGVSVIGLIGALSGRSALRQVESERLIELR